MKQKSKKIIAIVVIALIILAGIVAVKIWGFNKELKFTEGQRIDIYTEQQVDREKVKSIADEILGMHNMVQTVEIYEDMVTIKAKTISKEQKNSIVNKMKEIYNFEQTTEKTEIKTVPTTRIRDMYKQYVLPFVISAVLVVVYMMIRYHKRGIWKVCAKTLFIPVVVELLFLSWMAIVGIPVGRFTPVLIIMIYIASIWFIIKKN